MFEQSVLEARTLSARPWTMAISLAAQIAIISAAVIWPMLHPDVLQRVAWYIPVIGPPRTNHEPVARKPDVGRVVLSRRVFVAPLFTEPAKIPTSLPMLQDDAPAIASAGEQQVPGVVGGSDLAGIGSPIVNGIARLPEIKTQPVQSAVKDPPKAQPSRIAVSTGVQAARLIDGPKPLYPPLAKQARVQGTVHLAAVIGVDGRILDLRNKDGHPLLVGATIDAVKRWVYHPTLLNGVPVEVVTEITVTFTLQ